ncbi:D-amino-acid transaminase, partial [Bacillus velezensis]
GKPVGSGAPGPVAKTIQEAFQSHIQQELGVQS